MKKIKIKKGDMVSIISGKDRGKTGKVLRVFPTTERLLVEGVAIKKRHRKPRKAGEKGQVITMPSPMHVSNVLLNCNTCGRGVRTGYQMQENSEFKIRVCKKCKNTI
jgi:large subunit ribosomal protein L24